MRVRAAPSSCREVTDRSEPKMLEGRAFCRLLGRTLEANLSMLLFEWTLSSVGLVGLGVGDGIVVDGGRRFFSFPPGGTSAASSFIGVRPVN